MQWRSLRTDGHLPLHYLRRRPLHLRAERRRRRPPASGLVPHPAAHPHSTGPGVHGAQPVGCRHRRRGRLLGHASLARRALWAPGGDRRSDAERHRGPLRRRDAAPLSGCPLGSATSELAVYHAGGDDVTVAEPRKVERIGGPRLCTAGEHRWSIMEGGRPVPVQRKRVALVDIVVGAAPDSGDEAPAAPTASSSPTAVPASTGPPSPNR